jgi:hypothetical protein
MRALRRTRTALRSWLQPDALDAEVAEELRFHLDREADANLEAGMTPGDARRAAHVTIGNISAVREASRAGRSGAVLHQAARDLELGMRLARKAPGFAASAALVVALGIGTTTAIFSVVYGVMLRPLPYDEAERLVALWSRVPGASQRVRLNAADQRVLVASNTVFDDIALATAPQNFNSSVTDRRREFGVRLALGATRSDVSRLVLRKGAALAGTGAALGLGGAVALIRGMESLLYGVPRFDPVSFSAAGALLFGVALIASYLPARRAALTDPARTLRTE